jgi:hypothetical protein
MAAGSQLYQDCAKNPCCHDHAAFDEPKLKTGYFALNGDGGARSIPLLRDKSMT